MLSGRYWPYHPKPRADELLSSWILRTAAGHGQPPYTFCNTIWPQRPVLNRDVDHFCDPIIWETMAARTGTPRERAYATTLPAYEGWLVERFTSFGSTRWLLRSGLYHRLWRNAGLQYCPACLASDEVPYFRRAWRLALTAACSRHGSVLLDRCPQCDGHVMPHRATELHLCSACGFDLRTAPTVPADHPALVLHRRHETFLIRGWAQLGETHFARSHLYFDLLRQVVKILSMGPRSQALRDMVAGRWGGDPAPPRFLDGRPEFEILGPPDRHRMMALAARLLEGWPFRFVGACAEARVWYSWAMKDLIGASRGGQVPYAYEEVVRRFLHRPFYVPSAIEVRKAREYLARCRLKATKARLKAILGDSKMVDEL